MPQSQTAALPRHQEEEETNKSKQAQIDQTYEKHYSTINYRPSTSPSYTLQSTTNTVLASVYSSIHYRPSTSPPYTLQSTTDQEGGWSGGAKVSCILRHRGVQLILAYSWARPAILVAGKGRGGMFLFLLFLHFHPCSFLPCSSLSSLLLSLLSLFPFSGRRHKMTHKG